MLSKPQSLVLLEGLGKLKKLNDLIRSQICSLPACSIVSHHFIHSLEYSLRGDYSVSIQAFCIFKGNFLNIQGQLCLSASK
jgi:hypothetical protein